MFIPDTQLPENTAYIIAHVRAQPLAVPSRLLRDDIYMVQVDHHLPKSSQNTVPSICAHTVASQIDHDAVMRQILRNRPSLLVPVHEAIWSVSAKLKTYPIAEALPERYTPAVSK